MKQEKLAQRLKLLELGEVLGYPRLTYGRPTKIPHDKRIKQGKPEWEKFCAHAHSSRIPPALRIANALRDHGVTPFHPLSGKEVAVTQPSITVIEAGMTAQQFNHSHSVMRFTDAPAHDLLEDA